MLDTIKSMTTGEILTAISIVSAFIAGLNKQFREFVMRKLNFRKDTTLATDDVLDSMMARINSLSDDFVKLSESNSETQKENFELKREIAQLKFEMNLFKDSVGNRCINHCLILSNDE